MTQDELRDALAVGRMHLASWTENVGAYCVVSMPPLPEVMIAVRADVAFAGAQVIARHVASVYTAHIVAHMEPARALAEARGNASFVTP